MRLDDRSSYDTDAHACIIAKNVCLAGVKSVTLYDPEPVTLQDLSSQVSAYLFRQFSAVDEDHQYFLRETDVGSPRAAATLPRLSQLNAYVPVRDLGGQSGQEISVDMIRPFQVGRSGHHHFFLPLYFWCRLLFFVVPPMRNNSKSTTGHTLTVYILSQLILVVYLGEFQFPRWPRRPLRSIGLSLTILVQNLPVWTRLASRHCRV